jgi:hypothetical protein
MTTSIEQEILFDVLNNPGDTFYENVLSDFLDEQGVEHDFRKPLHNNPVAEQKPYLKPYQEKCLDIWAKHWFTICFCINPTDNNKAEKYFFDIYNQLGISKPEKIIWFDNPIKMFNQTIFNFTSDEIKYQVWNQVSYQVCKQVNNQLYNLISNRVNDRVVDQVKNKIVNQIWNVQHDIYWFTFYTYMMQVLRIEAPKQLLPYMLLAKEVNWWFPTEETVFATNKPKEFIMKDNKLVKIMFRDNSTIT